MVEQLDLHSAAIRFHAPTLRCQRWRDGRGTWRPSREALEPRLYGVDVITSDREAREFCQQHHYSGSYPAARCRVGLYRPRRFFKPELVGLAVFSVPAQQAVVPRWLGVRRDEGIELGRFVLLDDVEGNGETWFLARALRLLKEFKPGVRRVVSYSDPMERRDRTGRLVKPGHFGTIYQGANARFLGRSKRGRELLDRDGRVFSRRSLSKIRNGERGAEAAERRLVERGAPPRRRFETGPAYVERALREGGFRSAIHPGKLVYAFGLGRRERRALRSNPESYPREASA